MKSKTKKILAVITACILITIILFIINSFVGNPVSKYFAERSVKQYISAKYSDLELETDKPAYNFKFGYYTVNVKAKNSIDTHFDVYCNGYGRAIRDDYEIDVLEGFNTWQRVNDEYSKYAEKLIKSKLKYDYDMLIADVIDKEGSKLELDKKYDMHDKAIRGSITLYIYSDDRTWDNVAKVTRELDKMLSDENLNIDKYTVVLDNKADKSSSQSIGVYDFDKKLIDSENLPSVMENYYNEWEKEHEK